MVLVREGGGGSDDHLYQAYYTNSSLIIILFAKLQFRPLVNNVSYMMKLNITNIKMDQLFKALYYEWFSKSNNSHVFTGLNSQ